MAKDAHKKTPRITVSAPSKFDTAQPIFSQNEFDKAIETKGYDVEIEKGLKCPCFVKNSNAADPRCMNCGGTGYFFIQKRKTVAVIQSMNLRTKYLNWSETDRGTIQVTVKGEDRVAFMDRIRVMEVESIFSQHAMVHKTSDDRYVAFLFYQPTNVEFLFVYKEFDTKLVVLQSGVDFSIGDYCLIFTDTIIPHLDVNNNAQLSVRYYHNPTYHVIDINREIVKTFSYDDRFDTDKEIPVVNPNSQFIPAPYQTKRPMPVNSVARKVHFMHDAPNATGESLYDNTPENG